MFNDIENNKFFRKNNIINLIDGDFFSWYLNEFSEFEFEYFYNVIEPIVTINTIARLIFLLLKISIHHGEKKRCLYLTDI